MTTCPRTFITIFFIICFASNASAQAARTTSKKPKYNIENHHEIFAGYGIAPATDWLRSTSYINEKFLHIATFGFSGSGSTEIAERSMKSTGSFFIGYKYRTDSSVSIGATYSYSGHSVDEYKMYKGDLGEKMRSVDRKYHSLAAEMDVRYMTRKAFTLYSTVGAGVAWQQSSTVPVPRGDDHVGKIEEPHTSGRVQTNFHISLFGIKAGNEKVGGFVEVGVGYKGLVSAGVYVRL